VSASETPRPETLVAVGRVGRPHGLNGAFVVEEASNEPERFAVGARVYMEGAPAEVVESKRAGGRLVVKLDRDAARGAVLEVPRVSLPSAGEGSFYAFELVGLAVEEEGGRPLGKVQDVTTGVANDVLELDSGIALPMVEDCIRSVDTKQGLILVSPGFADPS
jgi:16S rRNA processing protein RimM